MAPYQYQGLDAERGEIRLVHLLPGNFEDAIEIELLHAELPKESHAESSTTKLHFEALSYVWGPHEDNPRSITVRGAERKALEDSLSTLRLSENEHLEQPYAPNTRTGSLYVRQNLNSALRHLRQVSDRRILWCVSRVWLP